MSAVSSFELAFRMAYAQPDVSHLLEATDAFMLFQNPDADHSENPKNKRLSQILSSAVSVVPDQEMIPALILSSSFLVAGMEDIPLDSIPVESASRQVVSLALLDKDYNLEDVNRSGNGFPIGKRPELTDRIYNASGMSESQMLALSEGFKAFRAPSPEDEEFASSLLSSSPKDFVEDSLSYRTSIALKALKIDADSSPEPWAFSALSRISSDFSDQESVPSSSELSVRIASDIAIQARASRLIEEDPEYVSESESVIRSALFSQPEFFKEVQSESKGLFHDLPLGVAMDVRSDIASGANLDADIVASIGKSVSAYEAFIAKAQPSELTSELVKRTDVAFPVSESLSI